MAEEAADLDVRQRRNHPLKGLERGVADNCEVRFVRLVKSACNCEVMNVEIVKIVTRSLRLWRS